MKRTVLLIALMLIAACILACKPVAPEQAQPAEKAAMGDTRGEQAEAPAEKPVAVDHAAETVEETSQTPADEAVEMATDHLPDMAEEQPAEEMAEPEPAPAEPAESSDSGAYKSTGQMGKNGLWISGERARDEKVVLETTKGKIVLQLHADWAPNGVAHFIELVKSGVYDGAPVFRCMHDFMVQFGIPADPEVAATWMQRNIEPDEVKVSNRRGIVTYAMAGRPETRSTQIFINYHDKNSFLDRQQFAPFAEVIEGMEVAESFTQITDSQFGAKRISQGMLAQPGGLEKFKTAFPKADFILKAYILED